MKTLITLIISGTLAISGYSQTRNVLVGTNNAVVQPTNFWSADASNARTGLGLESAATNPASAFQPASTVLSNLASSNGVNLTNIQATNITGTIAISNGGSGATTAGGARTNLGLGSTNSVNFFKVFLNDLEINSTQLLWNGIGRIEWETRILQGGDWTIDDGPLIIGGGTNSLLYQAQTRTNLGLGWSALTNTNASGFQTALFGTGTNPVLVNTNGEVISPTNFWQEAPITTTFIESQPATNSSTNISPSRLLHIHSLATNIVNVTNTIVLPTNTLTFEGDMAMVVHKGSTNSLTQVRQAGSTNNIITLNKFNEAVEFTYYNNNWQFLETVAFTAPIYFSGTNAAANAAASRTNLGLGDIRGQSNTNDSTLSSIVGGSSNYIFEGQMNFIGGGMDNYVDSNYGFIGGGSNNQVSQGFGVVVGGMNNQNANGHGFIGGGQNNIVSGYSYSSIVGGENNNTTVEYAFIGGGSNNSVVGGGSAIVGGISNTASGLASLVAGGETNAASGNYSAVVGGMRNRATNTYSVVVGGLDNLAIGEASFIGAGGGSTAAGVNSFVGSGQQNAASGADSFVGGGIQNEASGYNSVIAGGNNNLASGSYSFASGRRALATNNGAFVWADGQDATFSSTNTNSFNVRASGGMSLDLGTNGIIFRTNVSAAATRTNLGLGATNIVTFAGLTNNGDITINQTATNNGLLYIYRTNAEPFLGLANLIASNNTTISNETLFRVGVAEATNKSAQFGFRSTNTNGDGVAVFSVYGYNALMMIGPSDPNAGTNPIQATVYSISPNNKVMTLITTNTGATLFHRAIEFENTTNQAVTRTNLGLPLAALTNTSVTNFQKAIFYTNTAPSNVGGNLGTIAAWIEIVASNGVTYKIPAYTNVP